MDKDNNQSGFSSFAERLGSKRERGNRDHNKDHRLSKASIGQPIKMDKNAQDVMDNSNLGGTPCMVMKCVIVQRDENGYGLTVSGNNPVFVQSVKEDGAAQKAGVLQDDRIIKVNGEKVVNCNHVEVVKMIKADSYVALTLLGLPISSNTNSPQPTNSENTTSNNNQNFAPKQNKKHAFFDQKVDTIKKMLEQEKDEVERIKEEYAKNPSQKLLMDLGTAQKLKQDLEKQLWKVESTKNKNNMESIVQQSSNNLIVTDVDETTNVENMDGQPPLIEMEDSTPDNVYTHKRGDSIATRERSQTDSVLNSSEIKNELVNSDMPESAQVNNSISADSNSDMDLLGEFPLFNNTVSSEEPKPITPLQQNESIMNFEDDDLVSGAEAFRDHGPFNDFEKLRLRPAHLAVFINFVLKSGHDSSFLLFTLAVDNYKQLSSSKELLKQAEVIFRNFLAPQAPLKVSVEDWITNSIKSVIQSKSTAEDPLRQLFDNAVEVAIKEIQNYLQDYRMKREQGLANWYGDRSLPVDTPDGQITSYDAKVVEDIISSILLDLQQISLGDELDQAKMSIKQDLLQNFLTQNGTKRKSRITKVSSYFMKSSKDKPSMKGSKVYGSMESIVDDHSNKPSRLLGFMPKKKKPGSNNESTKSFKDQQKRDKAMKNEQTIWENLPPSYSSTPLKPTKVDNSIMLEHQQSSSNLPISPLVTSQPKKGSKASMKQKFSDGAIVSVPQKSPNHGAQRSQSVPTDEVDSPSSLNGSQRTSVIPVIQSTYEPPSDVGVITGGTVTNMLKQFGDGVSESNQADSDNLTVTDGAGKDAKKRPSRSGSFRRLKDEEKRKSGPSKSHSDPDKNKIEQAITEHNSSMDNLDGITDSPFLTIEDQKLLGSMAALNNDPEIHVDGVEHHWSDTVPNDVKRSTDKKEVKRQEVINELITTEQHHVRDLKILQMLFYEPLKRNNILSEEDLFQIFPNLGAMLELHREFFRSLEKLKENDGYIVKYIGQILLTRFDGDNGNRFKEECAQFCGNQTKVLSFIKERSKKDPKFSQLLAAAQRHPICRKLHLKDFVPIEFQRLTKYPLLLESIIKTTKNEGKMELKEKMEAENNKVKEACSRCREILAFVNQTVKEAEDKQKIVEIQLNLDRGSLLKTLNSKSVDEFKNIDLTKYLVIYQGPLTWKLGQMDKRREIPLHCILFEHVMVLLQKQDDRYILKCHGSDKNGSWTHMPFIKLEKLIVRPDATDKRAFFVMSTSKLGPKMFQFSTVSRNSKDNWIKIITEANDAASKRDATIKTQRREAFSVPGSSRENGDQYDIQQTLSPSDLMPSSKEKYDLEKIESPLPNTEDIPALSIIEKLQIKQEEISASLTTRHSLLATLSGIEEDQLESVLEMSSIDTDPEARSLVMHSLLCVDKLTALLNDCTTPENSFVKRRALSSAERENNDSNRLSIDVLETGYNTDNENNSQEKWAIPVVHPSVDEKSSTSAEVSEISNSAEVSTLNCVSDIPTSPSEESILQQEADPVKNMLENTEPVSDGVTSDNEQYYEATEPATVEQSPSYNNNLVKTSPQHLTTVKSPTQPSSFLFEPPKLEITGRVDDSTNSSRPSSGVELMSRGVPITRMMDIVVSLQTQLTQLMKVTEDNENEREKLKEEKQEILNELTTLKQQEMEQQGPPPTYADTVQGL